MTHIAPLPNGNLLVKISHTFHKVSNRRRILAKSSATLSPPMRDFLSLIARSHQWRERLRRGHYTNLTSLARELGFDPSYFYKRLNLIHLSPYILDALLAGRLPSSITYAQLIQAAQLPLWEEQHQRLGLVL